MNWPCIPPQQFAGLSKLVAGGQAAGLPAQHLAHQVEDTLCWSFSLLGSTLLRLSFVSATELAGDFRMHAEQ